MKATFCNQMNSFFLIITLFLVIMITPINSKSKDEENMAEDYTLLFDLNPNDLEKLEKYTYMFDAAEEEQFIDDEEILKKPMIENEQKNQSEIENNTYTPELDSEETKFYDQEKEELMNQYVNFDHEGNIINSEMYTQDHENNDLVYHMDGEDYVVSEMYKNVYNNLIQNEDPRNYMGIFGDDDQIDDGIIFQEHDENSDDYINDDYYESDSMYYDEQENDDDYDEEDDYQSIDDINENKQENPQESQYDYEDLYDDEDEDDDNDEELEEKNLSLSQKSSAAAAAAVNAYVNNADFNEDFNNGNNDIQASYDMNNEQQQTEYQNTYSKSSTLGYSDEEIRTYINPSDDLEDTVYLDNMDYLHNLKQENKEFDSLGLQFRKAVAKLMVHNAFRAAPVYYSQQVSF
jgi:hypothetical protein